jgi:hypothetical protein
MKVLSQGMEGRATFLIFGPKVPIECNAATSCEHVPGNDMKGQRTERISHARNKLLTAARARGAKTTIPVDLDLNFREETSVLEAVYNAHRYFKAGVTLGVTYAGPQALYYDMWAVRYPESNCNMFVHYSCPNQNSKAVGRAAQVKLMVHITRAKRNNEAVVVDSAFNGLAVYKGTPQCVYHGLDNTGGSDLGHSFFNRCIGGVIIDPQFPMAEPATEHCPLELQEALLEEVFTELGYTA